MTDRWWAISDEALTAALHRAHNGDDPEIVRLELYANSDTEQIEGDPNA